MKIFLSWSGDRSRRIATALRDWLPDVIQALEPWTSSDDIEKGESWFASISESLVASEGLGIFCLTPENLESVWMAYEAGALASRERGRVLTFLVGINVSAVRPPLGLFQATVGTSKDDVLRLLFGLNAKIQKPLTDERLRSAFDTLWPRLDATLQAIVAEPLPGEAKAANAAVDHLARMPDLIEEVLAVVRRIERDSVPRTFIGGGSAGASLIGSARAAMGKVVMGNVTATAVLPPLPTFGEAQEVAGPDDRSLSS